MQEHQSALPEPQQGGSYTRDPGTGELVLVHRTLPAQDAAAATTSTPQE